MRIGIVLMFVGFLAATGVSSAKKFPLTADKSVPAASGQVNVGHDKNGNTKVEITVEHLATPENLTPARAAYVVWFQERGAEPVNQGLLKPDKKLKATFKGVTSMKSFDVLITAEADPNPKSPSTSEIFRASVQQ